MHMQASAWPVWTRDEPAWHVARSVAYGVASFWSTSPTFNGKEQCTSYVVALCACAELCQAYAHVKEVQALPVAILLQQVLPVLLQILESYSGATSRIAAHSLHQCRYFVCRSTG